MIDSPTAPTEEISLLKQKADAAKLPPLVRDRVATQIDRLARLTAIYVCKQTAVMQERSGKLFAQIMFGAKTEPFVK